MTFIVPIFLFFQNNFRLLYSYAAFLSEHPLIKTFMVPIVSEEEIKQLEQYNTVLVRGTFDHLHLGHQVLLLKAIYSTSQKLIIEVKDDSILNNKRLKELLQPVDVRRENVRKFI
jgi:pantetheine-phosphate adenylyltransferase